MVLAFLTAPHLAWAASHPAVLDLAGLDGSDGFVLNGVEADSNSGRSLAAAGDFNGDGVDDFVLAAPSPLTMAQPGQAYVVFGSSDPFSATFDLSNLDGSNGFTLNGIEPGDEFGSSVAAGDINGDGVDDLLIGAPGALPVDEVFVDGRAGQSYVVYGSIVPIPAVLEISDLDGSNGFMLNGSDAGDSTGSSVAAAGDINGDGLDDFLIGASGADPNGLEGAGKTYVIFGDTGGFPMSLELQDLDGSSGFVLNGADAGGLSGLSVAGAGDVNGDGLADLLVGTRGAGLESGDLIHQGYVVFGSSDPFPATFELSSLDGVNGFVLNGFDPGNSSGSSVAGAGDVNGDGVDDLVVGVPAASPNGDDGAGETYVVFGSTDPFAATLDLSLLDGTDGFVLAGEAAGDSSGASVASGGDVNGDGIGDLLVGAPAALSNGALLAGKSYLIFGGGDPFPATLELSSLDGRSGFVLNGTDTGDFSGASVAAAGDINGDGLADLMIGADGASPNDLDGAGKTYIVFGQSPCRLPAQCGIDRANEQARRGLTVATTSATFLLPRFEDEYLVGDWDGNGCDDLAIRRKNLVLMSTDLDGAHDLEQRYGRGNGRDIYLVGDWNQDGCDDLAVRRGSRILMETTFDGAHDIVVDFGLGDLEDEYIIGDVDGNGGDDVIVRQGDMLSFDLFPWDGVTDGTTVYGLGNAEDQYCVGHWNFPPASSQTFAVRRGNAVLMNFDFDQVEDFVQMYGTGNNEDEYLIGDWDGDGGDNLAVRRRNRILMDVDYNGSHDLKQRFGRGTE